MSLTAILGEILVGIPCPVMIMALRGILARIMILLRNDM